MRAAMTREGVRTHTYTYSLICTYLLWRGSERGEGCVDHKGLRDATGYNIYIYMCDVVVRGIVWSLTQW